MMMAAEPCWMMFVLLLKVFLTKRRSHVYPCKTQQPTYKMCLMLMEDQSASLYFALLAIRSKPVNTDSITSSAYQTYFSSNTHEPTTHFPFCGNCRCNLWLICYLQCSWPRPSDFSTQSQLLCQGGRQMVASRWQHYSEAGELFSL